MYEKICSNLTSIILVFQSTVSSSVLNIFICLLTLVNNSFKTILSVCIFGLETKTCTALCILLH